jgi:hypothetical protein
MMRYYFVKGDLYGVPKGTVERFADHKAALLVRDGKIEPYDEKRHADKPGSPKLLAEADARRAKEKADRKAALLDLERAHRTGVAKAK